jgi:hypothetical protein
MGWLNLLLKGKKVAGVIKGVKPGTKTGAKSVEHWKSRMDMKKVINKASDAAENLQKTFKKSDEVLGKLKKTVQKTKHYYAPKDF